MCKICRPPKKAVQRGRAVARSHSKANWADPRTSRTPGAPMIRITGSVLRFEIMKIEMRRSCAVHRTMTCEHKTTHLASLQEKRRATLNSRSRKRSLPEMTQCLYARSNVACVGVGELAVDDTDPRGKPTLCATISPHSDDKRLNLKERQEQLYGYQKVLPKSTACRSLKSLCRQRNRAHSDNHLSNAQY